MSGGSAAKAHLDSPDVAQHSLAGARHVQDGVRARDEIPGVCSHMMVWISIEWSIICSLGIAR